MTFNFSFWKIILNPRYGVLHCVKKKAKNSSLQSLEMEQMKKVHLVDCEDIIMQMSTIFFLFLVLFWDIICNTLLALSYLVAVHTLVYGQTPVLCFFRDHFILTIKLWDENYAVKKNLGCSATKTLTGHLNIVSISTTWYIYVYRQHLLSGIITT